MAFSRRKTFQIKIRESNIKGLKAYNVGLTGIRRDLFTLKYCRILDLLTVQVQKDSLTTLAQFFDSPSRCFLFQNFLLAPSLEEFGKIVKSPKITKGPYQGLGHIPTFIEMACVLSLEAFDLEVNLKTQR